MHKYMISIILSFKKDFKTSSVIIHYPETAFIAVSTYQNTNISKLKFEANPYAKAFRYPLQDIEKDDVNIPLSQPESADICHQQKKRRLTKGNTL